MQDLAMAVDDLFALRVYVLRAGRGCAQGHNKNAEDTPQLSHIFSTKDGRSIADGCRVGGCERDCCGQFVTARVGAEEGG